MASRAGLYPTAQVAPAITNTTSRFESSFTDATMNKHDDDERKPAQPPADTSADDGVTVAKKTPVVAQAARDHDRRRTDGRARARIHRHPFLRCQRDRSGGAVQELSGSGGVTGEGREQDFPKSARQWRAGSSGKGTFDARCRRPMAGKHAG